ncbi:MAG TPA: NAD-dependent epimerase/dehydratase family protein [Acidimicrobiia bacterium]|nr:NAD-dependent epimerase/dehydratase family protein [Acidimicrobiia bacterium]
MTVLRYFTVYGPAGGPDMSICRFIRWIDEGSPLIVFGDGTQQRDFTYVDDIAAGTVAALCRAGFAMYNLGSDRPVRLDFVIGLIEEELARSSKVEHRPAHRADVKATWASIGRARSDLEWAPTVPIEEGIEKTVSWYRDHQTVARSIAIT